jgi:hypothetical protein
MTVKDGWIETQDWSLIGLLAAVLNATSPVSTGDRQDRGPLFST